MQTAQQNMAVFMIKCCLAWSPAQNSESYLVKGKAPDFFCFTLVSFFPNLKIKKKSTFSKVTCKRMLNAIRSSLLSLFCVVI